MIQSPIQRSASPSSRSSTTSSTRARRNSRKTLSIASTTPEQYGGEAIARIPDGWVIDRRDVAPLVLQQIEREDAALVERLEQPDPDMHRFHGRLWPAPHAACASPAPVSANSPAYAAKTPTKTRTTKTTKTTERTASSGVPLTLQIPGRPACCSLGRSTSITSGCRRAAPTIDA